MKSTNLRIVGPRKKGTINRINIPTKKNETKRQEADEGKNDWPQSVTLACLNSSIQHQASHGLMHSEAVDKGKGSKNIGSGFMGSVHCPPLPCQDVELEREIQRISKTTRLVLKHTELAMGLTAVHTSNFIRDRWERIRKIRYHSKMATNLWTLLNEVRSHQPEDFFVLTLSQVCSNCMTPDGKTPIDSTSSLVGIYMPHGGKKWNDVLPPGSKLSHSELEIIRHTIAAVLLLHGLGITHNDIRRANITIDAKNKPRLIDWELRSRPKTTNSTDSSLYVDELPDDRRWYQSFVHGFFSTPSDLIRLDWIALKRIFALTWPMNDTQDAKKTQEVIRCEKLLTQVIHLIEQGSDKHALLAYTLLQ